MTRRPLPALLAALALSPSAGAHALSPDRPGILSVAAGPRHLLVRVAAASGRPVALAEWPAWRAASPSPRDPVLWRGRGSALVRLPRFDGPRDRLFARLALVDLASRKPLGSPRWVDDPSAVATRRFPLPEPRTIKGLFLQDDEDGIALGAKHAAINVVLNTLFDRTGRARAHHAVDGERLPLNVANLRALDARIRRLTAAGVRVNLILLNGVPRKPAPDDPFVHPATDCANSPASLGGFNTASARGLRWYRGGVEVLAERYTRPDAANGWIAGIVIGNEVQSHWHWHNLGRMAPAEVIRHYALALRVADIAARRFHPGLRVYASLDHYWAARHEVDEWRTFAGRDLLEGVNAIARAEGDFPWQVAFHPYPENLFEPRFWRDRRAALSFDTPKITFKNLEVLPAYLRQPRFLCHGQARRVILTEQGFHTPDGPDGEKVQAAALAVAYRRVASIPGIDAFIYFQQIDHKQAYGLRMGLWTWKDDDPRPDAPGRRKLSYDVFRLADTPAWREAFAFALPMAGLRDWSEVRAMPVETRPDPTPLLTIAVGGRSEYRIVLPDRPRPVERTAAAELQRMVEEASGARLPIVEEAKAGKGPAIWVGDTRRARTLFAGARAPSPEDGVAIRTAGRDVVLAGGNERGVLYAVYALLERFAGVRFLARDATIVPKRDPFTLPRIDFRHAPPFMYREALYADAYPREIAARQRFNGPATRCDETTGGKIAFYPYVHSFSKLVPPEVYYAEHPEYFSLVGGKRTNQTIHGQLCLTNPDVLRIATEQALRWLDEHPDVPILDISQNDGEGACECEKCAAVVAEEGSQHGPILRFVNAIADAVKAKRPDRWVETLAYAYSTRPPAKTRPRDNVIIRLCHAGCYHHGFEACGLGANLTSYLEGWRKLTRRIFIWHYAANFAHYLAPNFNLNGLARDLRYYASHGVNGVMVQANHQGSGGELAELRQYLVSQLLWDPSRDPAMVRIEFCEGYYGPASDEVLEYLALVDREGDRPDVHAFGAWDPTGTVRPEFVREGLAVLERASKKAASPPWAARLDRLFLPLWYMQLQWPDRYGLHAERAPALLAEFARVVRENGVTYVREDFGSPSMPGWLAEMRKRYGAAAPAAGG